MLEAKGRPTSTLSTKQKKREDAVAMDDMGSMLAELSSSTFDSTGALHCPSHHGLSPVKQDDAATVKYAPEELSTLRGIFSLYDTTNSGYITPKALEALLQKMDRKASQGSSDGAASIGNGDRISFNMFLQIIEQRARPYQDDNARSNMRFMRIVEEYRHAAVSKGNYLEAEQAAKQLAVLKKQEEKRRHQVATARKISDRAKIKAAHNKQYLEFTAQWDHHMKEFDEKSAEYVSDVKQRQATDLAAYQDKLVEEMESKPPKWSHELIQWRKRQHLLAEQKNYSDAQKIKTIADAIEDDERESMNTNFAGSFERKEASFRQQQSAEIQALLKRINVRRVELEKQRERDCKRLIQRNRNVQAGMESKHTLESAKLLDTIKIELRNEISAIREDVVKSSKQSTY